MGMTIDELKAQKIWICWNYAMQNGNRTKKPCAADGGITGSNHAFRASWVTFEEAQCAAEASSYGGVGFIIPKGMYFLDIDHRDEADAMVQLQIRRHDTYAEKSVSGNGIHIYGCCDYDRIPKTKDKDGKEKLDPKFYVKNPHNKMELYVGGLTNRFAVFTGDVFHDAPLNDGTEAVLTTLQKDMLRKQPVNTVRTRMATAPSSTSFVLCEKRRTVGSSRGSSTVATSRSMAVPRKRMPPSVP